MSSKVKSKAEPEAGPRPDPIELERRRLAIVLGDETGFRLYLATCDDLRRRDDLIARLARDLAKQQVSMTRLDVSGSGQDSSLAELLRRHIEEQTPDRRRRAAVMVVGIENLLDHRPHADGFGFLERANIQREALPKAAPFPVVLWLTPRVSAALPKVATDLWHWRAATFEFTGGAQQRVDVLRQLTQLPDERRPHLRSPDRADRAALLEELIAELDSTGPPSTRREIAERITLLHELGTTLLDLRRVSDAKAVFEREIELTRAYRDAPGEAAALSNLGDALIDIGDLTRADEVYKTALRIYQSLAAQDPTNSGWQRDLSVSLNKIGDVQSARGNLDAALEAYQDSHNIFENLAAQDPTNSQWQRDLSVSYDRIGDVQRARGDLDAALEAYRDGLDIREKLAAQDPTNSGWQRDLSVSLNKIGDVQSARGNLDAALEAYQDGLDIREKLAAQDPTNSEWQRDRSVSFSKIGDVQRARGNLDAALKAYRDGLDIAEMLAAQDPTTSAWQRDRSVSLNNIGDVQRARGNLDAALEAYRDGLDIAEKLAAQDPTHSGWQRDRSVSLERIGDVQRARGDLDAALAAYQDGLEIREKLAAQDPTNSGWQRDLIVSNVKLAEVAEQQDDRSGVALGYYRRALEVAVALQKGGRLAPVDTWMVGDLEARLERVSANGTP